MRFHSWTEDGALRAPVFLRLRDDVDPKTVRRTEPGRAREESSVKAPPADDPADLVVAQLESTKTAFTLELGPHRIRLTTSTGSIGRRTPRSSNRR